MPKTSALDRVTADLKREIAVLQAALDRLELAKPSHGRVPKGRTRPYNKVEPPAKETV